MGLTDALTAPLNSVEQVADTTENSLYDSVHKKTDPYKADECVYRNGKDFTAVSSDGPLNAPADNSMAVSLSQRVEFIHFGHVYRDGRERFAHDVLDDTKAYEKPPVYARAIQYRGALEREAILLAGFLVATKRSLAEQYDTSAKSPQDGDKPSGAAALAGALQGAADLFGGATDTKTVISETELTPFFQELNRIAPTIDQTPIPYDALHQAGLDLHALRVTYYNWVVTSLKRLDSPTPDKGGGLLAALPVLGPVLSGPLSFMGPLITLAQKWSLLPMDVYHHMTIDYTRVMLKPVINGCRAMSEDALTRNAHPAFPVWNKPPEPEPEPEPEEPPAPKPPWEGGNVGEWTTYQANHAKKKVEKAVDEKVDQAKAAVASANNWMTRPTWKTPGSAFLDIVFERNPEQGEAGAEVRTGKPAEHAVAIINTQLERFGAGFKDLGFFGPILSRMILEMCTVLADFTRGAYTVLPCLLPDEEVSHDQMLEAGRTHLINQLIYILLDKTSALGWLRQQQTGITLPVLGPLGVSAEGLLGRLLEKLHSVIDSQLSVIDGILKIAMFELAEDLGAAKKWAGGHMTLEVYLATLPVEYAKLVRHLVFPLIDLLLHVVYDEVIGRAMGLLPGLGGGPQGWANALGGKVRSVGNWAHDAQQTIRDYDAKVTKIKDAITKGFNPLGLAEEKLGFKDASAADSETQKLEDEKKAILGAKGETKDRMASPTEAQPGPDFPFGSRKPSGEAKKIDDPTLKAIKQDNLWKDSETGDDPDAKPADDPTAKDDATARATEGTAP